ncbi:response regulator transcription factor [Marinifilum fragile]|uniref:response regulator transcription factor n=1 Tax=Marinifilum fragile TaxID=570161 RepID=UPI0006D21106|nr:response regulator transcription factor [Marinifilum fragile]
MNIVVIEDHHLLKKASAELLTEMYPDANIESFTYPSKAKAYIQNREIHLMLVDLEYNNKEDGIAFIKELKKIRKELKCIAYTSHNLNQILKDIRSAGFNSYLNKDVGEDEIVSAIDAVMNLHPDVFFESSSFLKHKKAIEEQDNKYYNTDYEMLKSLTKTEKKALKLISEDSTSNNDHLAHKLGIQLNTLKKHLSNIYRKLNVRSKDGLKHFHDRVIKN